MNNLVVLAAVSNGPFSRGSLCSKVMNHPGFHCVLPALGPVLSFLLHPVLAKHNRNYLADQLESDPNPEGHGSSYNLLAASVYFTAHLRISLIFFHHLLHSFKTSFITSSSRLLRSERNFNCFIAQKIPVFSHFAVVSQHLRGRDVKIPQNQISGALEHFICDFFSPY